jgi:hypothetical protein
MKMLKPIVNGQVDAYQQRLNGNMEQEEIKKTQYISGEKTGLNFLKW